MLNFKLLLTNNNWKDHQLKDSLSLPKRILTKERIKGVYIFWWTGTKEELSKLSTRILIQGRKQGDGFEQHEISYKTDWFPELSTGRYALYVGKTMDIYTRFTQHLYRSKTVRNEEEMITYIDQNNHVKIIKKTTTCQFRSGWQSLVRHLSEEDGKCLLEKNITFSYLPENVMENRFYMENYLIGTLKPWFNLDSER